MKILYYHQHFSTPGGAAGMRSYAIAQRLLARGHQVTMICGTYDTADTGLHGSFLDGWRRGVVDGIDVLQFELPYSNADNFLRRAIIFMKFAIRSLKPALREKYDVLFATSTPLTVAIPGIVAAFLLRRPFVFEVRDLWPELPRAMGVITNRAVLGMMSLLEWLAYRTASACVGLAPGIVDGIARRGIDPDRIKMIPNGCDLELFSQGARAEWSMNGIEKEDFVAVFAGTHGIANGLDAVLDTAKVLIGRKRLDIKLLLVGTGRDKPQLVARAAKEGLVNCMFHDPIPKQELARLFRRADIGLMILANVQAFYFGTSPNKFFDYIAAGLPVLTNYPGWIANLIERNACGVMVSPADPIAFADALERFANRRDDLLPMRQRSLQLANREFDRTILSDQVVDLLEEVLADRKMHRRRVL